MEEKVTKEVEVKIETAAMITANITTIRIMFLTFAFI